MVRIWLICAALVALSACNSSRLNKMVVSGGAATEGFYAAVPFDDPLSLIVVEARINGQAEPARLIWDTGADMCLLSEAYAEKAGALPRARVKIGDSKGKVRETTAGVLQSVEIGGVRFEEIAVGIVPFPENSPFTCFGVDGFIGGNLIRHAKWQIDYANKTLALTDDAGRFPELKALPPMRFAYSNRHPRPFIEATVGGAHTKRLLIDTGYNGSVSLDRQYDQQLDSADLAAPSAQKIDRLGAGLWGARLDTLMLRQLDVALAGDTFPAAEASFEAGGGSPKIGNELLRNRVAYFDYETSSFWLAPRKDGPPPADDHTYGFAPEYAGPDYWLTGQLQIGGQAESVGLAFTDTIWTIDGKKPSELFEDYCGYMEWVFSFRNRKEPLEIVFGADKRAARIVPRRIFREE